MVSANSASSDQVCRVLILRKMKWSEADLILHSIQQDGSRLHMLARGALKSKRRFAGGILEPTHYIEAVVKRPRSAEGLVTLEDARLLEGFEPIRGDYDRLNTALKTLEMIDRTSPGGAFPGMFSLLGHSLRSLSDGANLDRFGIQFALKFLRLHGVLEMETWMSPYLRESMSSVAEAFPEIPEHRSRDILTRLENFVQQAEIR